MFKYLAGYAGIVLAVLLFAPIEAQATPNLLLNPSFEILTPGGLTHSCGTGCSYSGEGNAYGNCCSTDSSTIPDWTISAFTQAAGEEIPGTAAPAPIPDGVAYAFTSGGSIYQTTATDVVVGDTYTLTAWIANLGGYYNQFAMAAYTDYDGTNSGTPLFGAGTVVATEGIWTEVSGTYTATADAGDPITVILFNNSGQGQVQFDDVCLTIGAGPCTATSDPPSGVPEPLTLSIFGAGLVGAAAMRRRKVKSA